MILYKTEYLDLRAVKRENKPDWVYAHRANAKKVVVILPLIKTLGEDEVLFLITKRPPLEQENIAQFCVEIPAGLVGDEIKDETEFMAIKKELFEETGMNASEIKILSKKVSTSGGMTSEIATLALAIIKNDNVISTPESDGGVIVDRIRVKRSEIKKFLIQKEQEGFAISALALASFYYLEREYNETCTHIC